MKISILVFFLTEVYERLAFLPKATLQVYLTQSNIIPMQPSQEYKSLFQIMSELGTWNSVIN